MLSATNYAQNIGKALLAVHPGQLNTQSCVCVCLWVSLLCTG